MKSFPSNSLFLITLISTSTLIKTSSLTSKPNEQIFLNQKSSNHNQPHYNNLKPRQIPINNKNKNNNNNNNLINDGVKNDPDCMDFKLNRGTWAELGIDNYLLNYPHGQNISLAQYTRSLNVLNFDCGINEVCLAGQLCHPIRGRDWVVLSAVQEWNFYINSLYKSVGSALGMVQGVASAMVADFLPEGNGLEHLKKFALGLVALSGVIILGFASVLALPILSAILAATWSFVVWGITSTGAGIATAWIYLTTLGSEAAVATAEGAEAGVLAAEGGLTASEAASTEAALEGEKAALLGVTAKPTLRKRSILQKRQNDEISTERFQMWTLIDTKLTDLQNRLRSLIAISAKESMTSPISSKKGLFGVLQNGTFLSDHPPRSILQENAEETAQLGALALLFKVMDLIFVVDSQTCKPEGPTTPLKKPNLVHYCSPQGVKVSLGMLKKKEIDYNIRNGRLIFSKYGFSTEFLYELASDCQSKRLQEGLLKDDQQLLNNNNSTLALANKGSTILRSLISNSTNLLNNNNNNNNNNQDSSSGSGSSSSSNSLVNQVPVGNGLGNDSGNVSGKSSSSFNLSSLNHPIKSLNDSTKSTVLLPDGSAICSFPIPVCDLRSPDVKSEISSGKSIAEACMKVLNLQPSLY